MVFVTIKNGTVLGIYLFILYAFASLFRAFVHEGTILENRIHAIRLGRLYTYLKLSGVDGGKYVREISQSITADEIEKAFGWNIETTTAFKDINPEIVSKSAIGQIAGAVAAVFSRRSNSSS